MKRLRVPATVAFVLATTGAIATSAVGCDDDDPPVDAGACQQYCIPSSGSGSNCPPPTCVDQNGNCPTGCEPEPIV